ncbi:MAG: hypothetical protein JSS76_19180 [Bacteroidetes bacterium]|nr:hypothetical protein [Bacteroidota bacterium]
MCQQSELPNQVMGIAMYDIHADGCLQGLYTNYGEDGLVYNEISRKSDGTSALLGEYVCMWFDVKNAPISNMTLEICMAHGKSQTYFVKLKNEKGGVNFCGIGYKMNDKQLVISYWNPNSK